MTLNKLQDQIRLCQKCPLRADATAPVPGLGDTQAKYFILGEAPGKEEDREGIPFVGASGKRLDKLIKLAGIDLNDCYISNCIKCRPPQNRVPRKAERLACLPWLMQELALVKPESIITLGATALSLFSDQGVRQMHGCQFEAEIEIGDYNL